MKKIENIEKFNVDNEKHLKFSSVSNIEKEKPTAKMGLTQNKKKDSNTLKKKKEFKHA